MFRRIRGLLLAALVIAGAAIAYYAAFGDPTDPENASFDDTGPRLVGLTLITSVMLLSLLFGQPKVRVIIRGTLFWGGLGVLLLVGYTYRADLVQAGYRVLGSLSPGLAVPHEDGSILIVRDAGGHFVLKGRTNGVDTDYLLDTGASAVVLTYEDAQRAGFHERDFAFTVPVSTANGRTLVAPVKIDRLQVGEAVLTSVRAFVARDGALEANLFGMTALDRLQSWRIEGDRLIMTP